MPKTPAQARFNKLKNIYEHADNQRKAEHDHQRQQSDNRTNASPTVETNRQPNKSGE